MDLNQLRDILDLVRAHELSEFEVEQDGLKLKIRRNAAGAPVVTMPAAAASAPVMAASSASGVAPSPASAAAVPASTQADDVDLELAIVKSPIVGTFYRSPEPAAPPFVDIGVQVKKGQVLCIIEAMKLMNEIESEYDGEVVNVYVESGQPIQYGERLFAIRTR